MIRRTPTVASGLQRGSNREAESTDAPQIALPWAKQN
jgi:hypothetical protein